MTTERDAVRETEAVADEPPPRKAHADAHLSRTVRIWTIVVLAVLVTWFFVAWLVIGLNVVDAAGESIGSGLAILVIVSVVGAVRRRRRG